LYIFRKFSEDVRETFVTSSEAIRENSGNLGTMYGISNVISAISGNSCKFAVIPGIYLFIKLCGL